MNIGIATAGLSFAGNTLATKALGGSETAVISMAKALAKRGNKVKVFCECSAPGTYDDVDYYNRSQFVAQSAIIPFDVLVACRWAEYLATPSLAGLRVLWLHDMPGDKAGFMPTLWQCDMLMGLSDFHIDQYCNLVPQLRPYFWKTSNGVDISQIERNIKPKDPNKLIYTSRPERGLMYLMAKIMPRLLEKNPNLRLHYCTYQLDGTAKTPDSVKKIHDMCDSVAAQLGKSVVNMGSLQKDSLYQQISSSKLMLYPSAFPEISYIGGMETAACGTPIVTTDDFALSETIGEGGVKIPGNPENPEYLDKFVDATLRLLNDQNEYDQRVAAGKKWVKDKGYIWDFVAASWENKFNTMLDSRLANNKEKVIKSLVLQNDLMPAKIASKKFCLAEIESECSARIANIESREYQTGDVADQYAKSTDRFQKVFQLMSYQKKDIKTFLDYECSDISAGIVLKKLLPDLQVTICARSEDIAKRLQVYAEKTGVEVSVITKIPDEQKFDAVYVDCRLEFKTDPQEYLKTVQKQYLVDGGAFCFSTRVGDEQKKFSEVSKQLWNLDSYDLVCLLKMEGNIYHLTFHDERSRPVFENIHGCWIVAFKKTFKFGKFDIQAKLRRTRPYQKLTACIIAKDCETWIPFCLQPILAIADEILVTDTGSSDRTKEVSSDYGATVVEVPFDNFSQARNFGIDKCTDTDWILSIDTDERLSYPDQLRKYLSTSIFEGLILKQKHLSLDVEKVSYDVPVRVWKNKPQYRYTGYIHEHVEDTSIAPFDQEIQPALIIPDVEMGHFGYENENQRRTKCSRRNLELLIRDEEVNGKSGRMMTKMLLLRDCVNVSKWSLEKSGAIKPGSWEHELLVAGITIYQHFFADGSNKYCELARKTYEDCLLIMASCDLNYPGTDHPPFQVCLTLAGALGGMDGKKSYQPSYFWFLSDDEFVEFVQKKTTDMVVKLGISEKQKYSNIGFSKPKNLLPLPDIKRLLSRGLHAM